MKRILQSSLALGIFLAFTGAAAFAGGARVFDDGASGPAAAVSNPSNTSVAAIGGSAALAATVLADSHTRNGNPIVPYDPAVDANGNPIVDPVVYNSFCTPPNAVIDPANHPVTYSKWVKADGAATMRCEGRVTRVRVDVTGLIPHGVYTAWVIVFGPGPALPDGSNLLGIGALGRPDGSQNHFVVSDNGEGHLDVIMPAGVLSELPYPVGPCLLTDPNLGEVHIGLAYHMDGQTHGGSPGNPCSFALPLAFSFITR